MGIVAAACLLLLSAPVQSLTLSDAKTGNVFARFPIQTGQRFSVTFVHSVNKTPVRDIYEVRDGNVIYVVETDYYDFDAGVQTALNPGETLTIAPDGAMEIKNIDQELPNLVYVVGTVSDHVMALHGQEFSLRKLCGKNSSVHFAVVEYPF